MSKLVRQYLTNSISGITNQFTAMLAGVILMPFLIGKLGEETFGMYQIAYTAVGVLAFLDMGISPSLIRFFADSINRADFRKLTRISTTGSFLLGGLGAVGATAILIAIPFLFHVYAVPPGLRTAMAWMMVFLSGMFFFQFLSNVPRAILLGHNRYDLANVPDILSTLSRLGLAVLFFSMFEPELYWLGVAFFLPQLLRVAFYYFMAHRLCHSTKLFDAKELDRAEGRSLLGFSSLNLISALSNAALIHGVIFLIGKMLGPKMVTAFSPCVLISTVLWSTVGQFCSPIVPLASRDVAQHGGARLGDWSIRLGHLASLVAWGLILPFLVFSPEILHYWLGESLVWVWPIVVIVVSGVALSAVQSSTYYLALGSGSIAPVAWSYLVLALVSLSGLLVGCSVGGWGLMGIALWLTALRAVRNVLFMPWVYSRKVGYSFMTYMVQVYLRTAFLGLAAGSVGYVIRWLFPPNTVSILLVELGVLMTVYLVLVWFGSMSSCRSLIAGKLRTGFAMAS